MRGEGINHAARTRSLTRKVRDASAGTGSPICDISSWGNVAISPDVRSMHTRYLDYRQHREPLPSMAYFCLTVVELSTGRQRKRRSAAAKKYRIAVDVLDKIGFLSSEKGGTEARKAGGVHDALSARERKFLVESTKALIRRVAEVVYAPKTHLSEIRLSNFPPV